MVMGAVEMATWNAEECVVGWFQVRTVEEEQSLVGELDEVTCDGLGSLAGARLLVTARISKFA